jgi:dTDP-4-dehydrorhamnose reductase
MMGGGPLKDKKFVNKIIKQIRGGAKELCVVGDKLGTPTYTYEFAKMLRLLMEKNMTGVYHGACDGGGSRIDVAWELLGNLGLQESVALKTVYSNHFKKEYFAKRPYSEKLVSSKLDSAEAWQDCLKDYLNRFEWGV